MAADEADWLQALVASERLEGWLDVLRAFLAGLAPLHRVKQAVRELGATLDSEAYVEEVGSTFAGCPLAPSLLAAAPICWTHAPMCMHECRQGGRVLFHC